MRRFWRRFWRTRATQRQAFTAGYDAAADLISECCGCGKYELDRALREWQQ